MDVSSQPVLSARDLEIATFHGVSTVFEDRVEQLLWALAQCDDPAEGFNLEFGVWQGWSINRLAKEFPHLQFWGFDSFEGLPEDWVRTKAGDTYAKGHFALPGLPNTWPNVRLVKGFFDQSLPLWLEEHPGPVRFAHIDCDLYSGAKYVLTALNERLHPGAIVVFDELCDWADSGIYDAWEQGEWQALREWMEEQDRRIQVLSRDVRFSAVIRVVE